MKRARRYALGVVVVALAGLPGHARAQEPPMVSGRGGDSTARSYVERLHELPGDLRSLEVLRFECKSELGRRDVTLFGNGTVRLFDGAPGEEEMSLGELGPDELEGVLARLDGEDVSEAPASYPDVEGDWVERCVLDLPLHRGAGPSNFSFSRYSSLPLPVSRLVAVADELAAVAEKERAVGLPPDYEPRPGDVLRRDDDDARFRVVDFTSDGKGIELEGLDVPLTLYLAPDQLRDVFAEVVSRLDDDR